MRLAASRERRTPWRGSSHRGPFEVASWKPATRLPSMLCSSEGPKVRPDDDEESTEVGRVRRVVVMVVSVDPGGDQTAAVQE